MLAISIKGEVHNIRSLQLTHCYNRRTVIEIGYDYCIHLTSQLFQVDDKEMQVLAYGPSSAYTATKSILPVTSIRLRPERSDSHLRARCSRNAPSTATNRRTARRRLERQRERERERDYGSFL